MSNDFKMAGIGDGDLLAVVRGCRSTAGFSMENLPAAYFAPLTTQQGNEDQEPARVPELFKTTVLFDELEQFYKPFYPQYTVNITPSNISNYREEMISSVQEKVNPSILSPVVVAAATSTGHEVKYKRRKNQHKREVLRVPEESLSSDMWGWRKYGQKPIKGSPYPRSYYRCSSSKGCLARKQVERSLTDPEMFLITYTAEHCHSQPTRRNSLAGTLRNKVCAPKISSTITTAPDPIKVTAVKSFFGPPYSSAALSPQSSPHPFPETVKAEQRVIKKESSEEEDQEEGEEAHQMAAGKHNAVVKSDVILSDEFFVGFDDLERLASDLTYNSDFFR